MPPSPANHRLCLLRCVFVDILLSPLSFTDLCVDKAPPSFHWLPSLSSFFSLWFSDRVIIEINVAPNWINALHTSRAWAHTHTHTHRDTQSCSTGAIDSRPISTFDPISLSFSLSLTLIKLNFHLPLYTKRSAAHRRFELAVRLPSWAS